IVRAKSPVLVAGKRCALRLQGTSRQAGYKEPPARQFTQRSEVICLPGPPRRAGAPARATTLSDWMVCLGLPRPCAGEAVVTNHKQVLQAGPTRSQEVSARIGVTSDEAENAPRLKVTYGKDSKESNHQSQTESRHTPPRLKIARSRFLGDGVLAQRE